MKKIKLKIKNFFLLFFAALYRTIRLSLGMKNIGVCIYHVRCSEYARVTLKQKPLYLSIPLITLRVLSCNPITALFLKIKNR